MEYNKKLKDISGLIGNTPLVEIEVLFDNKKYFIYAKCEWYNLSGSIKDRTIFEILQNAITNKQLNNNSVIIESSSGNTGISLSAMGNILGNKVAIVLPQNVSIERKQLLLLYGANCFYTQDNETLLNATIRVKNNYKNVFLSSQFTNYANIIAHKKTSKEILKVMQLSNKNIRAFACGVGTAGTLMGIASTLKQTLSNCKIIALQSNKAKVLNGEYSCHKLQGWASDFTPPLYDKKLVDNIINVDDNDSIYMAQQLSKIGLGVGITSGANFLGSILACKQFNLSNCITIFADDNKKYLSTSLSKPTFVNNFTNAIKILGFKVM